MRTPYKEIEIKNFNNLKSYPNKINCEQNFNNETDVKLELGLSQTTWPKRDKRFFQIIKIGVLNDIKLGKSIKEAAKNNNANYNTAKNWFRKKYKREEKLGLLPAPKSKRDRAFFQRAKIGVLNDIKLGKSVEEAAINNLVAVRTVRNWLSIKNRFGEQSLLSPKVVQKNKIYSKQNKNMVNENLISIYKPLENLLIKSSKNQNIKPPHYQKNLNLKLLLNFSQEELNNQRLINNIEISTQNLSCQVKIQLSDKKQPILSEQTLNNQEFNIVNNFNFAPQDNFLLKDLSHISYDPNETFEDLDLSMW